MIGGVGEAKTAGNYAAALKSQQLARDQGYTLKGTVRTPVLNGSILAGITRSSVIQLLKHWGIPIEERMVSIEEIYEAGKDGSLEEVFGTGTAADISPIGEMNWHGKKLIICEGRTGKLTKELYDTLTGIQNGAIEDPFGWMLEVKVSESNE